MKKWQNKINRRVIHYDRGWSEEIERAKKGGWPLLSSRAYRLEGFRDGAEWMLGEIVHLLRQKKHKCDKMIRESKTEEEKTVPTFASSLYSRIIKDLTE